MREYLLRHIHLMSHDPWQEKGGQDLLRLHFYTVVLSRPEHTWGESPCVNTCSAIST